MAKGKAWILGLVLLLASCGGGAAVQPSPTAQPAPMKSDLEARLVSFNDLGISSGWKMSKHDPGLGDPCEGFWPRYYEVGAGIAFVKDSPAQVVAHHIVYYPNQGPQIFAEIRDRTLRCSDLSKNSSVRPIRVPVLGDEQVGVRIVTAVGNINQDIIYFRQGDLLSLVAVYNPDGSLNSVKIADAAAKYLSRR